MGASLVVIALCAALVAAGIAIVVRWGSAAPPRAGASPGSPPPAAAARRALVLVVAGVAGGLMAAGAGGRLVMAILAVTSSAPNGTFTEAGALVGDVTVGGTLGLVAFVGVAAGLLSAALYALMRPVLPAGRAAGPALGAMLLVLGGSQVEPLRPGNVDFALVGPDWLSVLLFVVLALFQGAVVVALADRLSGATPAPFAARAPRLIVVARLAAVAAALVALPGFVTDVADILTSG